MAGGLGVRGGSRSLCVSAGLALPRCMSCAAQEGSALERKSGGGRSRAWRPVKGVGCGLVAELTRSECDLERRNRGTVLENDGLPGTGEGRAAPWRSWNARRLARRARARRALRELPLGWVALAGGIAGVVMPLSAPVAWWCGWRARRGSLVGTSRASRMAAAWGQVLGIVMTCVVVGAVAVMAVARVLAG